jgi:hypothetical protein
MIKKDQNRKNKNKLKKLDRHCLRSSRISQSRTGLLTAAQIEVGRQPKNGSLARHAKPSAGVIPREETTQRFGRQRRRKRMDLGP